MTQELDDDWYNQMSQALSSIQPNPEVVATTQSTQGISLLLLISNMDLTILSSSPI